MKRSNYLWITIVFLTTSHVILLAVYLRDLGEPVANVSPYKAFEYTYHDHEDIYYATTVSDLWFAGDVLTLSLSNRRLGQPIAAQDVSGIFIVTPNSRLNIDWDKYPVLEQDRLYIGNAICLNHIVLNDVPMDIVWKAVHLDIFPYSHSEGELRFDSSTNQVEVSVPSEMKEALLRKDRLLVMSLGPADYQASLLLLNATKTVTSEASQ